MKSYMGFALTPRSMTLDDLEHNKFEFSVNFAGFRRFRTQQQLNEWRQASIVSDNVVSTSNWSNFWLTFASRGFVSDSWAFLLNVCHDLVNFYCMWCLANGYKWNVNVGWSSVSAVKSKFHFVNSDQRRPQVTTCCRLSLKYGSSVTVLT